MHACTLHPCPFRDLAFNQSDVELDSAAQAVHLCEQCGAWDAAGLVAMDTFLLIINLDNQRDVVAVCHTCAAAFIAQRG